MTFRLLSCDGGGIRGYISSTLIQNLNTATDGALLGKADGFAGTSTGGLISIGLGAGVPIDTLVDIYKNRAATIFTRNDRWKDAEEAEADPQKERLRAAGREEGIFSGPGYFSCEYVSTGLANIMADHVGSKTFGQVTDRMIAVNTAQLWDTDVTPARWAPVTLNNLKVGNDYSSLQLVDAALATSAAPTYFPPHQIGPMGYFADGGTFANNPVMNGIEVALNGGRATSLDDIQVVSIGTGITPAGVKPSQIGDPLGWGALDWLWPLETSSGVPALALLNLTLDLSAQNAGEVTARLLGGNLVRINPELKKPVPLDGYSPEDYDRMNAAIEHAMDAPEWQRAIDLVKGW